MRGAQCGTRRQKGSRKAEGVKLNEMRKKREYKGFKVQEAAGRMLARMNASGSEMSLRHLRTYARCVKLL